MEWESEIIDAEEIEKRIEVCKWLQDLLYEYTEYIIRGEDAMKKIEENPIAKRYIKKAYVEFVERSLEDSELTRFVNTYGWFEASIPIVDLLEMAIELIQKDIDELIRRDLAKQSGGLMLP